MTHSPATVGSAGSRTDAAIDMVAVGKRFGPVTALDNLSLTVATGEIHGFLGPNGAGKSTAIRILLGMLRADSGTVRVLGGDAWSDSVALHRRLAYVPGDVTLWPTLSGGEVIDLLTSLRGIDTASGSAAARRRDELLQRFELDPRRKCRTYSKGNRQKVGIVAALTAAGPGGADLLVLDEPTSGLDPLMEAVFQDTIREATAQGVTVLLSSHILSEVEALCDRVSIIRAGTVVESGTLSQLRHLTRTTVQAELVTVPAELAGHQGVHDLQVLGQRVSMSVDSAQLSGLLEVLTRAGVLSLTCMPPTLEELFLRHYTTQLA